MQRVQKSLPKWVALSLVCLASIGLSGWNALSLQAKESETPDEPSTALRHEGDYLTIPEQSPLRQTLTITTTSQEPIAAPFNLPAVVEADPAKVLKVLTPLAGRIVSLNKQLGENVKAGDVLFTIDSADFAQATSDAAKAKATLILAKNNFERQRELDRLEIGAKHDLEQAQNDYEQAASEAARANARLAQLGAKSSSNIDTTHNSHVLAVRSPISGHMVDLTAAAGSYWNDITAPVMTVADLSHVFVTANAQEKDLAQIYAGQPATVRFDAYPESLSTQVRFVGEMLDPDTRTVKVRMLIDNHDSQFKPGLFAQVTLLSHAHPGIMIPITAVIQSGFYSHVFVEVAPWKFETRVVKLGSQIDNRIEVVSGLKAGERIVVKDGVLLND